MEYPTKVIWFPGKCVTASPSSPYGNAHYIKVMIVGPYLQT